MSVRRHLPGAIQKWVSSLIAASLLAMVTGCLKTSDQRALTSLDVSVNPPANFELEGRPFCFSGSNAYYPIFKPLRVVDDLFNSAQKMNYKVMRVWAMLDVGSFDGSVPHVDPPGAKENVYFQYFEPATKQVVINQGANGLQRLDRVVDSAARHDLKVILVLVNNWHHFGGIDQYVVWHGKQYHHEFYTDPDIRRTYKRWVDHLVSRENTVSGVLYRDDPTIFAWELANEPRAIGAAGRDSQTGWDETTITNWAAEMSAYIKSLDPNHMVSVGDEGFLDNGGEHWAYDAAAGVDHRALTALPSIDFGTFHLYPEDWGASLEWGEQWILDHLRVARELGKPTLLEEYGTRVVRGRGKLGEIVEGWEERERSYRSWNRIFLRHGGNASLVWMLAGADSDQPRYPDYDGFAFWRRSRTGELMANIAEKYLEAPACEADRRTFGKGSKFVRVRDPRAREAAAVQPGFWRL